MMFRGFLTGLFFSLTIFQLTALETRAGEVTIAVASNFARPVKVIAAAFEKQSGHHVNVILGSSGRIFAQITNGAPFDVFLSADSAKPAALDAQGLTVPGSRFTYAIGVLALWAPKLNRMIPYEELLKENSFTRIAIANPKLAPYGAAAKQVLQSLRLYQKLAPKLVLGENIAQTYQFIASGNADLGFVSASQLTRDDKTTAGSVKFIDDHRHRPIRQDAVLLKTAGNNPAAGDFMTFLRSGQVRKIILAHGYILPNEDP